MKKRGGIVIFCIIFFLISFGVIKESQADDLSALTKTVDAFKKDINKWGNQKNIMIWMVCGIGILGIALVPLQKFDKKHIKTITIIIGCLISALTLVKEKTFSVDHKELSYRIHKARKLMLEIDMELPRMPTDEIAKNKWYEKIKGNLMKILELSERSTIEKTVPSEIPAGFFPFLQSRASREPIWIRQPLADSSNIYFIGIGESYSFLKAEEYAKLQARESAKVIIEDYLNIKVELESTYDVRQVSAQQSPLMSEIEDYYFFTDPNTNRYRYYSLLKLNIKKIMLEMRFRQIKGKMSYRDNPSKAIEYLLDEVQDLYMKSIHENENFITTCLTELNREQYEKFMEGRLFRQKNMLEEALSFIQPVLEEKPSFFYGWFELALIHDAGERYQEAALDFEKASALSDRTNTNFYFGYGKFLQKQRKYPDAIRMFNTVLELSPNNHFVKRLLEKLN